MRLVMSSRVVWKISWALCLMASTMKDFPQPPAPDSSGALPGKGLPSSSATFISIIAPSAVSKTFFCPSLKTFC